MKRKAFALLSALVVIGALAVLPLEAMAADPASALQCDIVTGKCTGSVAPTPPATSPAPFQCDVTTGKCTGSIAAVCNPACTGGQSCVNGTCTAPKTTIPTADAVSNCSGVDGFVSLSCIPGFAGAEGATNTSTTTNDSLAVFFNLIYNMCIGIAVVIAVIQIIRGGIMYMGSAAGFSEKKEAKRLIQASLLGLTLVLSPVLIFGLIDSNINNFNVLTGDIKSLTVDTTGASDGSLGGGTPSTNIACSASGGSYDCTAAKQSCSSLSAGADDGTVVCLKNGVEDSDNPTPYNGSGAEFANNGAGYCPAGDTLTVKCAATVNNNRGTGAVPTNGCNVPTTDDAGYKQISCATAEMAVDWEKDNCINGEQGGDVSMGACTQFNADGSCKGGQYAQAYCVGVSTRSYMFVTDGDKGKYRPATNDLSAVEGYIKPGCTSGNVCLAQDGFGNNAPCPPGAYTRITDMSNPGCVTAKLACTTKSNKLCAPNTVLIGN